MLSLTQKLNQQQKLTPQQLQYLKLLQLSAIALEQRVKEELEINPLLEESDQSDTDSSAEQTDSTEGSEREELDWEEFSPQDAYDNYKSAGSGGTRDENSQDIPQPAEQTLAEALLEQLRMQILTEDEVALAEEIIGNIDADGYLRRKLNEIIEDLNRFIVETNGSNRVTSLSSGKTDPSFASYDQRFAEQPFGRERLNLPNEPRLHTATGEKEEEVVEEAATAITQNEPPIRTIADLTLEEMASLPIEELARILERGTLQTPEQISTPTNLSADLTREGQNGYPPKEEGLFTLEDGERILHIIQRLDPPGMGARDLRECLMIQLEVSENNSPAHNLAYRVLGETYREFTMKHFEKICRRLECSEEELRDAVDIITSLNPKPGEGYSSIIGGNYLTPDFVVERDGDTFVISGNDSFIPALRINQGYQEMLQRGKRKANGVDNNTRKFLRQKMESAKWFIASIHQRQQTMMKVMRAILELQTEFFRHGQDHLKPMIYRDVAERIGMDISTICRVVNGKYVQTDYGVFELRYFFSEALETAWGEEVSNKVVKGKIKELIDHEDKSKPLSDEAIGEQMKEMGYNIARRTVAKYREQLQIPVARLRREL
ncbi:MAG: RNA polymerase factor sigma-54 [Ignavibacteriae bacterium]|nr:RNA polymerase factor sigma-54 [Ignavibacteriota bacterium]MCB9217672.1 RNA polymerase factor sigma-54 [Ignavibacteria bacterium]